MISESIITEEQAESIRKEALTGIEDAVAFAEEGPMPTKDDLLTDVFA